MKLFSLSQIQLGSLLYKANLTAIQQNVMSHYYIKDAVVERNLPNSIDIQIIERIPVAMINLSEPLYLDEDGVVLPKTVSYRLFDLPMISGISADKSFIFGTTVTQPDEIEALQLLAVLRTVNRPLYHNISEIQLRNGGDIVLYSAEGGIPIIFGRGELSDKIARLELFWNDIVTHTRCTKFTICGFAVSGSDRCKMESRTIFIKEYVTIFYLMTVIF